MVIGVKSFLQKLGHKKDKKDIKKRKQTLNSKPPNVCFLEKKSFFVFFYLFLLFFWSFFGLFLLFFFVGHHDEPNTWQARSEVGHPF